MAVPATQAQSERKLKMYTFIEFIEDKNGDAVDVKVYCNSTCAYTNDNANAWPAYESETCIYCANEGCNKVAVQGTDCESCNTYPVMTDAEINLLLTNNN